MKKGMVFMGIGFELVGLILGAWGVGTQVDKYFHWNGFGVATFVIVVMIAWMYHLILLLKKFMNDAEDTVGDETAATKETYDNTDSRGHERKD